MEDLSRQSANPAWTMAQVVYHMSVAPRYLPSDVALNPQVGTDAQATRIPVPHVQRLARTLGSTQSHASISRGAVRQGSCPNHRGP